MQVSKLYLFFGAISGLLKVPTVPWYLSKFISIGYKEWRFVAVWTTEQVAKNSHMSTAPLSLFPSGMIYYEFGKRISIIEQKKNKNGKSVTETCENSLESIKCFIIHRIYNILTLLRLINEHNDQNKSTKICRELAQVHEKGDKFKTF